MKKKILIFLAVFIFVGAGFFYGGMKYGQNKNVLTGTFPQNFQNFSEEQRQQFSQGGSGERMVRQNGLGGGIISGEVIEKDEQSLIIKTRENNSIIIFFSDSSRISKTIEETIEDINVGEEVAVAGEQNSDGSYTAKTIQVSSFFVPIVNE